MFPLILEGEEIIKLFNAWIRLLRVDQWIKNFFMFAAPLFSFHLGFHPKLILGFLCFNAIASGVYIFNDYHDLKEDQLHPVKKTRPLASQDINLHSAVICMMSLWITAILVAYWLSLILTLILWVYIAINVLYTLKLKHVALLDIIIIAFGFLIRIYAGSVLTSIPLSKWIILITFLLALFLAIAKRREDVLLLEKGTLVRKNISGYTLEFINLSMAMIGSVTIVCYIMYTLSADVMNRLKSPHLYLTAVFVTIGILRYLQLTFVFNKGGNPSKTLLEDRFLQLTLLAWILSFLFFSHA
jgi:4-hydroxybenzoate polyprenyltransferase